MRLYLAGPMRGIKRFNFPLFMREAKRLRKLGYEVWNPAERDIKEDHFDPKDGKPKPLCEYMKHDLPAVLASDAVVVLPGWRDSIGAALEVHVARVCCIPVWDIATLEPIKENVLAEADRIVHGARRQKYGHPRDNFGRTAEIWTGIFGRRVEPEQVALCMIGVKLAREAFLHTRDNAVDICGYAATLEMLYE